jgi:hypothetical protein
MLLGKVEIGYAQQRNVRKSTLLQEIGTRMLLPLSKEARSDGALLASGFLLLLFS